MMQQPSKTSQNIAKKDQKFNGVRGLVNLGNTCFFNAVLQCFAQTPYLLDVLKKREEILNSELGTITQILGATLDDMKSGGDVYTPKALFNKFTAEFPIFGGGHQHDSEELLRQLLECIERESSLVYQKIKNKVDHQVNDGNYRPEEIFRGFLVSSLTCKDCLHSSSSVESFLDMSLSISMDIHQSLNHYKTNTTMKTDTRSKCQKKNERRKRQQSKASPHTDIIRSIDNLSIQDPSQKDIENNPEKQSQPDVKTTLAPRYNYHDTREHLVKSCLNNFTAIELMTDNNKVACEACTKRINGVNTNAKSVYTDFEKRLLVSSPPPVLILHFMRFKFTFNGYAEKLGKSVNFPLILDIAPTCTSTVPSLPNFINNQKKIMYALYAVIEHSGNNMDDGHYTAYVKVRPKLASNNIGGGNSCHKAPSKNKNRNWKS
jgi:ubiquitin C-terminal hydrolase